MADSSRVYLLYETGHHALNGRLFALLAAHIDGRNTSTDIAERLDAELTPLDVRYGLSLLEKQGLIVDAEQVESEPYPVERLRSTHSDPAFLDLLGVTPDAARQRLQQTVAVTALGNELAAELGAGLQALGIRVASDGEGDLQVALVDDYLHHDLAALSRRSRSRQQRLLIAKPLGVETWLGPCFEPQDHGCWRCLAARLQRNRIVETWLRQHRDRQTPLPIPLSKLPTTVDAGLGLIATAVYLLLVQPETETYRKRMVTVDQTSLQATTHTLVPVPSCPDCGTAGSPPPQAIVLHSRNRVFRSDGGFRTVFPEQTLQIISHHVSPITGIVRELKKLYQDQSGLVHVYMAGPNITRPDIMSDRGLRAKTAGKGMTEMQARTGAVCEALERYSGIWQGYEPRRTASFRELGPAAVDPRHCLLYSRRQYRERKLWNRDGTAFTWVPQPFDEQRELEWSPVWSMTEQTFKYLPTGYCYFDYPQHEDDICRIDSNGNAAGNTLEEAILQGILEVVERDAAALWWNNRVKRPGVRLESFNEPYFSTLQGYYQSIDRSCWVLDLTTDLEIPVFVACSCPAAGGTGPLILGLGAHLDATIAVSRALTEMNQLLGSMLRGADGPFIGEPEGDYLVADPDLPLRTQSDYRPWPEPDLKAAVEHCVTRIAESGIETLVLDLSRPDVELRAVKVFAPGLRLVWPRFAEGRLFDVPVELGWLKRPRTEDEMNPVCLTL